MLIQSLLKGRELNASDASAQANPCYATSAATAAVPFSLKAADVVKSTWCSDDSVATVDFMLPTGIMVQMLVEVNRHLIDIKAVSVCVMCV